MRWLCKLFKSGSDRGGGSGSSRHPQLVGEENMAWRAPVRSLVNNTICFPCLANFHYHCCFLFYRYFNQS